MPKSKSFLMVSRGIYAQNWQLNFEKAKASAKTLDRPIIMVFQGSDWCAPCKRLDREVWSSEEFKEYAEDHFVMVQVDFPRKSKKHTACRPAGEK